MEDCLDRACQWQEMGPHFIHNKDADFLSIIVDTKKLNTELEHLKSQRGRRCVQCSRLLIPTDGDHSFCDDCWDEIMYHPFMADEEYPTKCEYCGEVKEYKDHKPSVAPQET